MNTFQGWDVALNHTAVVEIDEAGELLFFAFTTDKVTIGEDHEEATLYHVSKHRSALSKKAFNAHRLGFFSSWIDPIIDRKPTAVAIEGYTQRGHNQYSIGEFGGALRSKLIENVIPYMTVAPRSIKTYAGISGKEKPIAFCWEEYGTDWEFYNSGLKADSAGDLSDAHVLAHMTLDAYIEKKRMDYGE